MVGCSDAFGVANSRPLAVPRVDQSSLSSWSPAPAPESILPTILTTHHTGPAQQRTSALERTARASIALRAPRAPARAWMALPCVVRFFSKPRAAFVFRRSWGAGRLANPALDVPTSVGANFNYVQYQLGAVPTMRACVYYKHLISTRASPSCSRAQLALKPASTPPPWKMDRGAAASHAAESALEPGAAGKAAEGERPDGSGAGAMHTPCFFS